MDPRTETHELRTKRNGENNEVENLNHLGIGIDAAGDKDCPDIEQDSFGEVDKGARNTVGATFDKTPLNPSGVGILNRLLKRLLEKPFERHGTD